MGICASLPDAAVQAADKIVKVTATSWTAGLEASGAAAYKAARQAKLAKYALVECAFDDDAKAKAKRVDTLRALLRTQIAVWKAWSAATVPMDYSVLSHWSRHAFANDACKQKLAQIAANVKNASAGHKEYCEFMRGAFADMIKEALTMLDAAWDSYEAYEKAEYAERLHAKMRAKEEEKLEELKAAKEAALAEAKRAIDACLIDVETKSLVPAYAKAIGALEKFAKQCTQNKDASAEDANADEIVKASLARANSVAYAKYKKRAVTNTEVVVAIGRTIIKFNQDNEDQLPETFREIEAQANDMRRHSAALIITLEDFRPFIQIIFGPDRLNNFSDSLEKKIDGFTSLKKVVAEFSDKVSALTNDMSVEEFTNIVRGVEKAMLAEYDRIAHSSFEYKKALGEYAYAQNAIPRAEAVYESQKGLFILPPIGKEKLAEFKRLKADWQAGLDNAKQAVIDAEKRSEEELKQHSARFEELFKIKECIFQKNVLPEIEKACGSITRAQAVLASIKPRAVSSAATEPEPEEEVATPDLTVIEANKAASAQAKIEAENAAYAAQAAAAAKVAAEQKAAEAFAAAQAAAAAAEAEADEEAKAAKLAQASAEAQKADAEEAARRQAAEQEAQAAYSAAEWEKQAALKAKKAADDFEKKVNAAEKAEEVQAIRAAEEQNRVEITRALSIKQNEMGVQATLDRRASSLQTAE